MCLFIGALLAPSSRAQAAPPEDHSLKVVVRNCAHLSEARLDKLLRIELTTLGWAGHPAPLELRVDCFPSFMTLRASVEGLSEMDRRLEGSPGQVDARETALSASELVAQVWESETQDEEQEPPVEPPPEPQPKLRSAPPWGTSNTLSVATHFGRWSRPGRFGTGAKVEYARRLSLKTELGLTLGGEWTAAQTDSVQVDQQAIHVAPEFRFVLPGKVVSWTFGVQVPMGFAWFRPESRVNSAEAVPLSGPWSAVLGHIRLRSPLSKRVFFAWGVNAGGVTLPIQGKVDGETVFAVDGWLYGSDLGLGISF